MTRPDCPACDSADTLRPDGPKVGGKQFHICTCCAKKTLVDLETGAVVRVGTDGR